MRIRLTHAHRLLRSSRAPQWRRAKNRGVKEVESKTLQAMENFDLLEFEAAQAAARRGPGAWPSKNKLDGEPILARVYLNLGIVEFAGLKNHGGGARGVRRRGGDRIRRSRSASPTARRAMAELLRAVKKGRTGGGETGAAGRRAATSAPRWAASSTRRSIRAPAAQRLAISARVGDSVTADEGEPVLPRGRRREVRRGGDAPARARLHLRGGHPGRGHAAADSLHYYVAALADGQTMASKGSRASPNIVMLAGGGGGGGAGAPRSSRSRRARRVDVRRARKKTLFVSLAVGTGGGYVSGATEVVGSDVKLLLRAGAAALLPRDRLLLLAPE